MSMLDHPFLSITLSWPPKECSPNFRGHWSKTARAKKDYREECWLLTRAKLNSDVKAYKAFESASRETPSRVTVEFHPARMRDTDNMIAAFKSGQDGIAEALGMDDAYMDTRYRVIRDRMVGIGYVVFKIWRPSWILWPDAVRPVKTKKIGVKK